MKYLYPVLLLALLSSCHSKYTQINGTTNGFSSGTFIIKDGNNGTIFTEDIEDSKFACRQIFDSIGFYRLRIKDNSYKDTHNPGYDVYLEPGTYTITAMPQSADQYPEIKSSSPIQTELSEYYQIANAKTKDIDQSIAQYRADIVDLKVSPSQSAEENDKLIEALAAKKKALLAALQQYVAKYPTNDVEAHIMDQLEFTQDPVDYYAVYQKFTDGQKKTPEGKDIGDKLGNLTKLAPGILAPAIAGNTLNGKPFDLKSLHNDVVLVEFWRSDNDLSRTNHADLLNSPFSPLKTENFTVVSVSMDKDAKTWKDAVKADRMTWTQVSDLKGDNSPNVDAWQITAIPSYTLVDGRTWKIIEYNISYSGLAQAVNDYLHPAK
jgi:peroxiredoxin